MSYNSKQVYEIKNPNRFGLPSPNVSSTYIFANEPGFFSLPEQLQLLCRIL